ncbi:MAG: hypothetical protein IRY95_06865 [Clostridia bacterium]|nr:hypothetical protein [Clostridia bacterium]
MKPFKIAFLATAVVVAGSAAVAAGLADRGERRASMPLPAPAPVTQEERPVPVPVPAPGPQAVIILPESALSGLGTLPAEAPVPVPAGTEVGGAGRWREDDDRWEVDGHERDERRAFVERDERDERDERGGREDEGSERFATFATEEAWD